MEVLREGHRYKLANFEPTWEDGSYPEQVIQFIEKVSKEEGFSELVTLHNGTTNEEVLKVLIDRLRYLNNKFPCIENKLAIANLQIALFHLEERTKERLKRGVEGKHEK